MTTFAEMLTARREAAGLSQYRLAQLAGLSKQTLSKLEKGIVQPSWESVQRLAKALGTDCRAFADPDLELPEVEVGKPGRPPKEQGESVPKGRKKR